MNKHKNKSKEDCSFALIKVSQYTKNNFKFYLKHANGTI